jgi:hypothetical protein
MMNLEASESTMTRRNGSILVNFLRGIAVPGAEGVSVTVSVGAGKISSEGA